MKNLRKFDDFFNNNTNEGFDDPYGSYYNRLNNKISQVVGPGFKTIEFNSRGKNFLESELDAALIGALDFASPTEDELDEGVELGRFYLLKYNPTGDTIVAFTHSPDGSVQQGIDLIYVPAQLAPEFESKFY